MVEGKWRYDSNAKKVLLDLARTEAGAPYRLPPEVGIGTSKVDKVLLAQKQQHFEIAADQEPASVELDPNVWLLIDGKLTKQANTRKMF